MISAKIDYLTISLLPDQSGWTISEALVRLFDLSYSPLSRLAVASINKTAARLPPNGRKEQLIFM